MKNLIFYSALLAVVLLVIRFIGLFVEINNANLFLFVGTGILIFITLPLHLTKRKQDQRRFEEILSKYKSEKKTKKVPSKKSKSGAYPSFSQKKSGLTWGGGNVHGSNAQRGSKKGFLS